MVRYNWASLRNIGNSDITNESISIVSIIAMCKQREFLLLLLKSDINVFSKRDY